MEKKKAKSGKLEDKSGAKDKAKKNAAAAAEDSQESRPFDMGGLPDRDLKKNLGGCG